MSESTALCEEIAALKATVADNERYCADLSSRCESLQALLRRAKPLVWCDRGCGCEGEALHDEIAALLEPKQDTKER